MNKIEITPERFLTFPPIKPGIVHRHKKQLYKYSPASKNIITTIDKYKYEEVMKQVTSPTAMLYHQKRYFGYTMEYYKKLKRIREAIKSGRIKDINEYMLNLLTIIEKLNELNLIYYDIHDNNVLVDENGKPFLIDIDDIVTIPSIEDFYQQSQYLTEFILNVYLEEYKTLRVHISDKELRKILSQKVISYMENLTVIANPAPSLPYVLLDELKDKEKVLKLKNKNI